MKTMRKGLVAAATALVVSTASVSVAVAEDTPVSSVITTAADDTEAPEDIEGEDPSTSETPEANFSSELSSGSSDANPDDITDWIGVFTAVIGGLSALFAFLSNF